jgi:hypothetical protein
MIACDALPALRAYARFRAETLSEAEVRLWVHPASILELAGYRPDLWQAKVIGSGHPSILLLCARQTGKTLAAIGRVLWTAICKAPALILVVTPSESQSKEFLKKIKEIWYKMKRPPVELGRGGDLVMEMRFANRSRILGLPQNERTVRIHSEVVLLVIDEGSRVSDSEGGRAVHMAKGDRWSDNQNVKVREMRNAETVLGIIQPCHEANHCERPKRHRFRT